MTEEDNFGVGGNTTRAFKHLQGDVITHNLHHLSQLAVDGGQFIVAYACGL